MVPSHWVLCPMSASGALSSHFEILDSHTPTLFFHWLSRIITSLFFTMLLFPLIFSHFRGLDGRAKVKAIPSGRTARNLPRQMSDPYDQSRL